jgi:hypothetical protein
LTSVDLRKVLKYISVRGLRYMTVTFGLLQNSRIRNLLWVRM